MLAPKIFPTPISGFFILIEVIVVTSSGIFVPIAITTKLTTLLFNPSNALIVSTLLTKTIAPSPIDKAEIINSVIILTQLLLTSIISQISAFDASIQLIIINIASKPMSIIDSTTPTLPSIPKTNNATTQIQKYIAFEKNDSGAILDGRNKNATPKTIVKLQTIDPTAVLTPITSNPCKLDTIDTVVSGKVVAIATIVAPTTIGGIFALLARDTADPTKKLAPFRIKTKPNINKITDKKLNILKVMSKPA